MMRANTELRALMREKRVPVWAVAAKMGVHENTLYRRLRVELPASEREMIVHIVEQVVAANEKEGTRIECAANVERR